MTKNEIGYHDYMSINNLIKFLERVKEETLANDETRVVVSEEISFNPHQSNDYEILGVDYNEEENKFQLIIKWSDDE
jgi:hypothetical protein